MIKTIIENTKAAEDAHGHGWGSQDIFITPEELKALQAGKCLANFDGEYVQFISLAEFENETAI